MRAEDGQHRHAARQRRLRLWARLWVQLWTWPRTTPPGSATAERGLVGLWTVALLGCGLLGSADVTAQPVDDGWNPPSLLAPALPSGATASAVPTSAVTGPASTASEASFLRKKLIGWVDSRTLGGYASVAHLLPADDTPQLSNLTEANLQLTLDLGEVARIYGDLSWVWGKGGFFVGDDGGNGRTEVAAHDVATAQPGAFISELYTLLRFGDRWSLTLGKKRLVWGTGLAWNPTDLLNPPKDPTDPTQQRSGSWLARVEGQYDRFSVSLVGAAKATAVRGGVPSKLLWNPTDDRPEYMLGGRVYGLVAETDLSAFVFYGNRFNDAFTDKLRAGAAFSRVVGGAVEVHGEVLVQTGSARLYFDPSCTTDLGAAAACVAGGRPVAANSKRDDGAVRVKSLVGVRYQFGAAASISAEYLYNQEGYNQAEYSAFANALALRKSASQAGLSLPDGVLPGMPGAAASNSGTPQKFSFEPARRHYLFLSYRHPQLADDFTISTVLLLALQDGSGQLAPQLTWSAAQWLNVSLGGFVTLPGFWGTGAQTAFGEVREFQLQPSIWRVFVAARAYF